MKIYPPDISSNLIEISDFNTLWKDALLDECPIENIHLVNYNVEAEDYTKLDICSSRFKKSRFMNCNFHRASFANVIFENCDFSNSVFSNAYFKQCEFHNCKFLGGKFPESIWKHCVMKECVFCYCNWNRALFESILMEKCDLSEASLSQVKYKSWEAINTVFKSVNFFQTKLRGFDFSKCEMTQCIVSDSLEEFKGAKVSDLQALEIAQMVGVKIAD